MGKNNKYYIDVIKRTNNLKQKMVNMTPNLRQTPKPT